MQIPATSLSIDWYSPIAPQVAIRAARDLNTEASTNVDATGVAGSASKNGQLTSEAAPRATNSGSQALSALNSSQVDAYYYQALHQLANTNRRVPQTAAPTTSVLGSATSPQPGLAAANGTRDWGGQLLSQLLQKTNPSNIDWSQSAPRVMQKDEMYQLLDALFESKLGMRSSAPAEASDRSQASTPDYGSYLQHPNTKLRQLAGQITRGAKNDDEKMYRIEQWVEQNIKYVPDIENYQLPEYWATPLQTVNRGRGDCEDGAFLEHSLALNANISPEKLRTYGGLADTGGGRLDGHAWTAYRRQTDNQWVTVDWCYWPQKSPLASRQPMKNDMRYVDDYFYVQKNKTVFTDLYNAVQNPPGLLGGLINSAL